MTALLDMPKDYCQSCGMMFTALNQHGHEADGAETDDYCRWCYENGAYTGDSRCYPGCRRFSPVTLHLHHCHQATNGA